MNISAITVRHPRVLIVAVLTAIAWGATALTSLPRQEDPELTWRLANVVTRLPGASPRRIESTITDVIEQALKKIDEVEHLYSVSRAGVSLIQIELHDNIVDAAPVWQKVRHKLSESSHFMPSDIIGPELDDEIMGTFSHLISLSSSSGSYQELKDYGQRLEDSLRFLPLTASTDLFGTQKEIIQIELDHAKLSTFNLTFDRIAKSIRNRNTRHPSGRLQIDDKELIIETSGEFESIDEVREMVLLVTPQGKTIRLRDVAQVIRTTRSPADTLFRINSQKGIVVGSRAKQGVRIDKFARQSKQVIELFKESLPTDLSCTVFHDLAKYTKQRESQLSITLLTSLVFVFLSTMFWMGWRGASIVTVVIPLTGFIVLLCFSALKIPLNQMSVMSVIMAFGLLVDNAIVVTEQIHRKASEKGLVHASCEEPSLLLSPLLVSTLTTTAAFLPIYLLPGGVGEFVRAIPIGLTICLITSLLVAMTVIPWLCNLLFASSPETTSPVKNVTSISSRFNIYFYDAYSELLQKTTSRPRITLFTVAIIMLSLGAVGGFLRRDFFSPVQRDQFAVDVYAPQDSSLKNTSALVEKIEAELLAENKITSVASFIGRNAPLFFYNLTSKETFAGHYSQLIVQVSNWKDTLEIASKVQHNLRSKVAGVDCHVRLLEHGAPYVAPFEVRISGDSISSLRELADRVTRLLSNIPGVRNIRHDYGNQALQLTAQVNEDVASQVGIDQAGVAEELRSRFDGLVVSHLIESDERVDISLRLPRNHHDNLTDASSIYLNSTLESGKIPFSSVAHLKPHWNESSIFRRDGRRTISVLAYPNFGLTAAQVSRRFSPQLKQIASSLPKEYTLELGGENTQRHEAESNLLGKGVYAFFLIALLLMIEFHSFRLLVLIFTVIPLSLSGAMVGLFLTGWPLNFMAIMGMMMLIGVVVNDAVILVDGYEKRRLLGEPLNKLVISGTMERCRHVTITTVTTIAGFLPLAFSSSLLWPPLAISIIGGLVLATLLTLIGIPSAYLLLRKH